jgi:hypothetical protein
MSFIGWVFPSVLLAISDPAVFAEAGAKLR